MKRPIDKDELIAGLRQIAAALAALSKRAEPPQDKSLVDDLVWECERAMKQRDEYLKTGVSTAANGGSHDTCFAAILRKHGIGAKAAEPPQDVATKLDERIRTAEECQYQAIMVDALLLRQMRETLPAQIEYQVLLAQITRAKFNALLKEGFTEEQAIQLCREAKP